MACLLQFYGLYIPLDIVVCVNLCPLYRQMNLYCISHTNSGYSLSQYNQIMTELGLLRRRKFDCPDLLKCIFQ